MKKNLIKTHLLKRRGCTLLVLRVHMHAATPVRGDPKPVVVRLQRERGLLALEPHLVHRELRAFRKGAAVYIYINHENKIK